MAGIAEVLNVGELVSLHWQLGVASQSNHCEELSAPFVRVQLKVKDQNAVITAHSFELNLLEFKQFSKHFHDIHELMEQL